MLWVMESDGFYIESLQKQTQYRTLLCKVPDEIFLDEVAEELTNISRKNLVTRMSLLCTLGAVAVRRRKLIEEFLKDQVGARFDWKVVSAGPDFEHSNGFSRFMGALLAPLPVVWIRIAL